VQALSAAPQALTIMIAAEQKRISLRGVLMLFALGAEWDQHVKWRPTARSTAACLLNKALHELGTRSMNRLRQQTITETQCCRTAMETRNIKAVQGQAIKDEFDVSATISCKRL
jgi:hypothetical protein